MGRAVDERVRRALDDAQRAGACLAPRERALREALRRRATVWRLHSPSAGLYVRADWWNSLGTTERTLALVRGLAAQHPNWVFCGTTAALLHGLAVSHDDLREIHVVGCSQNRPAASAWLRSHRIEDPGVTLAGGVRVTSLERTAFDCMRDLEFSHALAVADSTLRRTGLTRCGLTRVLSSHFSCHRGVSRACRVAALATSRCENGGESILRAQLLRLGFAPPHMQICVADPLEPRASFRLDAGWLARRGAVGVELDGAQKYRDPAFMDGRSFSATLLRERRREARLTAAGVRVARFSYGEVLDDACLVRTLRAYGVRPGAAPELVDGVPLVADAPLVLGVPMTVVEERLCELCGWKVLATTLVA